MHDPRRGPEPADVTVAALLGLVVVLYLLVLRWVAPPTEAMWARADPILTLLPREATLWLAPALAVVAAGFWWRRARPDRETVLVGLRDALIGIAIAVLAVGTLRLVAGPMMPAAIPPEESAGPGALLSMTAGFEEEVVCRLGVLPALYFGMRDRMPRLAVVAIAVLGTSLFFALWHAAGEPGFSAPFFVSRLLIPGCAMSLAWLVSPAAIVAGHAAAHVLIPALFLAPG